MTDATQQATTKIYLASPKVLWESIDSSTLVINLDNGSYYNLSATSSELWRLLIAGAPMQLVIDSLESAFAEAQVDISADVESWIQAILAEGLIQVIQEDGASEHDPPELRLASYAAPEFSKFTDLETLLLADPIHEFSLADSD